MGVDIGEKTQEATPHRRRQAYEEGHVAVSQDLATTIVLLGGLAALLLLGKGLVDFFLTLTGEQLGARAWTSVDTEFISGQSWLLAGQLTYALAPILGVLLLASGGAQLVQRGFLFLPGKISPDFSRIDPIAGWGRIFTRAALIRLGMGIIKLTAVAGLVYWIVLNKWDQILHASELELDQLVAQVVNIVLWSSLQLVAGLLVLAIADFGYQRWQYERDLRMTPQEVREEMKNLSGDPQLMARRRHVQRQLALQRLAALVAKSTVVVTNPDHLAVALRYSTADGSAPRVVAKGRGEEAEWIRRAALENHVPVFERKPLARALFRDVEVQQAIPQSHFEDVAAVLALVKSDSEGRT